MPSTRPIRRASHILPRKSAPPNGFTIKPCQPSATQKEISSAGWSDVAAGKPNTVFPFRHPFAFFAAYAVGIRAKQEHLKDEKTLSGGAEGR